MRRTVLGLVLLSLAQVSSAAQTGAPEAKPSSFLATASQFLGISVNPNTLKGEDDVESGQIWVAELGGGARPITAEFNYRSPIIFSRGTDILALRGDDLVTVSSTDGKARRLFAVAGVRKLIGFHREDPERVLLLKGDADGHVRVWVLSIRTGNATNLPYDQESLRDREMVEHLQNWQRTYGSTVLYVKRESTQAMSGPVEWSDVFVKVEGQEPLNVSKCRPVSCGQPSLSSVGNRVAFIKAEP